MSEGLAYSPDGKLLAASSGDYFKPGEVIIWDAATVEGTLKVSPMYAGSLPTSLSALMATASPRSVANGDKSPTLMIWDMQNGKELL